MVEGEASPIMKTNEHIHEGITVVGNDTASGHTVLFVVQKEGAVAFSFPMAVGTVQKLSEEDLKTFFRVTPDSEMLQQIRAAYEKLRYVPQ
jgi:hypothetical protein